MTIDIVLFYLGNGFTAKLLDLNVKQIVHQVRLLCHRLLLTNLASDLLLVTESIVANTDVHFYRYVLRLTAGWLNSFFDAHLLLGDSARLVWMAASGDYLRI